MKQHRASKRHRLFAAICAFAVLALLAACGGSSGGDNAAAAPTARAVPTMPQARFAAPTTMISSGSSTVTETTTEMMTETEGITEEVTEGITNTADAGTPEPGENAEVDLERGARIYANQNCAECHGVEGEGVAGQGSAIAGTSLGKSEFEDLMRTGGDIGRDHLYGPNAISPGGLTALHAWLQSLPPAE